ncbi:MAG: hypothetical protein PHS35_00335 [Dehalococcoidales bacterium]|nr:hypothetical protein [Dehalococcoidales bacterium]
MTIDTIERKVKLVINNSAIKNKPFVDDFIAGVADGLVSPLNGSTSYKRMQIVIEKEEVSVIFDHLPVKTDDFLDTMIKSTIVGMASILGVSEPVTRLEVQVDR